MNIDYILRVNNIDVYYTNETNGGGDHFLPEYAKVINKWYGKVDSVLEWCAGPGFIGYGLLGAGLCNSVAFNEIFEPAIEMCRKTASNNNLDVQVYTQENLDEVTEQFDLVVGNPPHWSQKEYAVQALQSFSSANQLDDRLKQVLIDEDWKIHKSFFNNMKRMLKHNGKILLQENATGSNPELWSQILQGTGLKVYSHADSVAYKSLNIYYLEVGHD